MTTPRTINAVQESTKCIEGLHIMHIDDAMLIDGAFRPDYFVQKLHLGNQNRQISAPNQLKWAIMTSPYTIFVILIRIFFCFMVRSFWIYMNLSVAEVLLSLMKLSW